MSETIGEKDFNWADVDMEQIEWLMRSSFGTLTHVVRAKQPELSDIGVLQETTALCLAEIVRDFSGALEDQRDLIRQLEGSAE